MVGEDRFYWGMVPPPYIYYCLDLISLKQLSHFWLHQENSLKFFSNLITVTSNGFLCCQHDWSLLLNWQKNIWRQKQSRFSSNPTDKIWYTVCLHSFITLASFEGLVVSLACLLLQRFYFVSHTFFTKEAQIFGNVLGYLENKQKCTSSLWM